MLFTILRAQAAGDLASEVQKYLDDGWCIDGEIIVVLKDNGSPLAAPIHDYLQPMTKQENRLEKKCRILKWRVDYCEVEGGGMSWIEVYDKDGKFLAKGADRQRALQNAASDDSDDIPY